MAIFRIKNYLVRMLVAGLLVCVVFAVPQSADAVVLDLNTNVDTTGPATQGTLIATFTDLGANLVQLTLSASLVTSPPHHIDYVYFNYNGNAGDLVASAGSSFTTSTLFGFDFGFDFPGTTYSGGTRTISLSSNIGSLQASDFLVSTVINGVAYYSVAEVERNRGGGGGAQRIGANAIPNSPPGVPEPGHVIFGVLLLGGVLWAERVRIRSLLQRKSETLALSMQNRAKR